MDDPILDPTLEISHDEGALKKSTRYEWMLDSHYLGETKPWFLKEDTFGHRCVSTGPAYIEATRIDCHPPVFEWDVRYREFGQSHRPWWRGPAGFEIIRRTHNTMVAFQYADQGNPHRPNGPARGTLELKPQHIELLHMKWRLEGQLLQNGMVLYRFLEPYHDARGIDGPYDLETLKASVLRHELQRRSHQKGPPVWGQYSDPMWSTIWDI